MSSKGVVNSVIVNLDPRGIIIKGGADVVSRQNEYGQYLESKSKNPKAKFVIFTSGNRVDDYADFYNVNISQISKPTFNSFLFARKSFHYIKRNNLDVRLLIAGDPWESYWSAYFLNKFLNKKIPIQIQVHGDIADPRWRRIVIETELDSY